MNCVSVQQENYKRGAEKDKRCHSAGNNTTSRVGGLRSCLRGEIEDAESKH